MSGSKSLFYVDTCIFLAHLKDETRQDPRDMLGVAELMAKVAAREIDVVTSIITLSEILECRVPPNKREDFKSLMGRKNCHFVDVLYPIAELTHDIRDYYRKQQDKDGLSTVETPDAIHLATAIYHKCDKFYTFDEKDDHKKKKRAILPLNGNVAGHSLIIEKPTPENKEVQLNLPIEESDS